MSLGASSRRRTHAPVGRPDRVGAFVFGCPVRGQSADGGPEPASGAGAQGVATRNAPSFWDHNEKGLSLCRRRAYAEAIEEFERAVSAATIPLATLDINLGGAYLGSRRYAEARAWLEKGLTLDPDNQMGHWLLARVLAATGSLFEALAELEQTHALDPASPEGRLAEAELRRLWGGPPPHPSPGPAAGPRRRREILSAGLTA